MFKYVHPGTHALMRATCVYSQRTDSGVTHRNAAHALVRQPLPWVWSSPVRLASKPRGSLCLCLQRWGCVCAGIWHFYMDSEVEGALAR